MKFLILISVICLVLLFVGGSGYLLPRSFQAAWDLGHILLFSILAYLLVHSWKRLSNLSFIKQCILVLALGLFFGAATEYGQHWLANRTPSVWDLFKNLVGCLVALAFLAPSRKTVPKTRLRFFQFGVLLVLLYLCLPLSKALIDETIAWIQFPLLSGFETPFEKERWVNGSQLETSSDVAFSGKSSLRVKLSTARFSGVGLRYFPGDWREYESLNLNVYHSSSKPLEVVFRIHDMAHLSDGGTGRYHDRFNRSYTVVRGWNTITIPLDEVVDAPEDRRMDMSRIEGLGVFVVRLPQPEVIYIDNVRLE